jgi:hypothetical protein
MTTQILFCLTITLFHACTLFCPASYNAEHLVKEWAAFCLGSITREVGRPPSSYLRLASETCIKASKYPACISLVPGAPFPSCDRSSFLGSLLLPPPLEQQRCRLQASERCNTYSPNGLADLYQSSCEQRALSGPT